MKPQRTSLHRIELLSTFKHHGGFSYGMPILLDGDTAEEALRSKLVLFEDGMPLRRGHEHHGTIAGTGRGAYSHWERYIFFSASDNTDPNKNGRSYSYAVDQLGQHQPREDGRTLLNGPFYLQNRYCWGVVVAENGDDGETETLSTLQLYEDSKPLGPSHAVHTEIEHAGAGRYSHWKQYLYFSSSDGSDPNINGRLYSFDFGAEDTISADIQHLFRHDGRAKLNAPFRHRDGLSWGIAVPEEGDVLATEALSKMRLYENGALIGPGHALHTDIEQNGAGRYSHWKKYLFFSTSDGSDPNTNGRIYTYDFEA